LWYNRIQIIFNGGVGEMESKKEFLRMINECEEIALATSIHDFPNVRIVNYYYDEKNNVMYFATYTGRDKISEFWKNNETVILVPDR